MKETINFREVLSSLMGAIVIILLLVNPAEGETATEFLLGVILTKAPIAVPYLIIRSNSSAFSIHRSILVF